jgi:hypothetical protein
VTRPFGGIKSTFLPLVCRILLHAIGPKQRVTIGLLPFGFSPVSALFSSLIGYFTAKDTVKVEILCLQPSHQQTVIALQK